MLSYLNVSFTTSPSSVLGWNEEFFVTSEQRLATVKLNQPPVNHTENNRGRRVEGNTMFRFRLVGRIQSYYWSVRKGRDTASSLSPTCEQNEPVRCGSSLSLHSTHSDKNFTLS